jgi:RNA polymerase sigma-70 factor (ECF subfamily)
MQVPITANDQLASLAQRAGAGDAAAFAEIVERFQADMARLCYAIAGDLDLAHDAVQSAWTIAWTQLARVRDPDSLRSWLLAIAANEARRAVRRDRLRRLAHLRVPDARPAGPEPRDLDLERALARLGSSDRELLALRFGLGMDSAEIAGHLRIGRSAVRMRLHRLLHRLRSDLTDG